MAELKKWAKERDGVYSTAPDHEQIEKLPCGYYDVGIRNSGIFLKQAKVVHDEIVPNPIVEEILTEIKTFMQRREKYKKRGFVHKRGVLLYGEPGCGKTIILESLIEMFLAEFDGVVLMNNTPNVLNAGIQFVRSHDVDRPILVLIEDIDEYRDDITLVNLLDGQHQVDHVVIVATTNYAARLPRRLIDRPSRFDLVRQIGFPAIEQRIKYIETIEPTMEPERVNLIASQTENLSWAHIKELLILTEILDTDLEVALKRVQGEFFAGKDNVSTVVSLPVVKESRPVIQLSKLFSLGGSNK